LSDPSLRTQVGPCRHGDSARRARGHRDRERVHDVRICVACPAEPRLRAANSAAFAARSRIRFRERD
jgi:hypothetical protein